MTDQATAYGAALIGLRAHRVTVHATHTPGSFTIHGLTSEAAYRETKVRISSAFAACFPGQLPAANVTIEGLPDNADHAGLDLAIAVAIMRLNNGPKLDTRIVAHEAVFVGELGFDGRVKPVRGVLPKTRTGDLMVVGDGAVSEAALGDATVFSISAISDGPVSWKHSTIKVDANTADLSDLSPQLRELILSTSARRVLLVGRPGSGKTLAARRFRSVLGPMRIEQALEVAEIHSAAGIFDPERPICRPFRAPHHSVSEAGLTGGGKIPRPGEASLTHHGVLFLDEITEFRTGALATLAVTLREGRARGDFPAVPAMIVASANPCPCGYNSTPRCHCGEATMAGWKKRLDKLVDLFGFETVKL